MLFRSCLIILLVIALLFSAYFMFWIHIPAFNRESELNQIRNEICETNNYEYMGYFFEHRGNEIHYIIRVKINGVESYVAYDEALNLISYVQGSVADAVTVKEDMEERFDISVPSLDVAYENDRLVYYYLNQTSDMVRYIYYDLVSGEFVKSIELH